MQIDILTENDISEVANEEKYCFSEGWSEQAFRDCLGKPGFSIYVLKENQEVCGYVCFTEVLDEADVASVCIAKSMRGKGVGFAFFERCLQLEQDKGIKTFFLEVRKSNEPAIGLYHKCGFASIGERKNFYHAPTEDAVMMSKSI